MDQVSNFLIISLFKLISMNTLDISKGPFGKSVQANDKLCHELPKLTGPNCHKSTESQPPDYTESGETASCVVSGISEEVRVTLALEQLPDGELWNLKIRTGGH